MMNTSTASIIYCAHCGATSDEQFVHVEDGLCIDCREQWLADEGMTYDD